MSTIIQFMINLDNAGFTILRIFLSIFWQSSILFVAVFCLIWFLRRRRASIRHIVLAIAILVIPLLPVLSWVAGIAGTPQVQIPVIPTYVAPEVEPRLSDESDSQPRISKSTTEQDKTLPSQPVISEYKEISSPVTSVEKSEHSTITSSQVNDSNKHDNFYLWAIILITYIAGVIIFLLPIVIFRIRVRNWLIDGAVLIDRGVLDTFRKARNHLKIKRDFIVVESDKIIGPMTGGTFHPKVLLPKNFVKNISPTELYAVALHEMAHIKRNDSLISTFITVIRAILFFHPLVWIAVRQVNILAEHACDDTVLDATGEPLTYAKMLARIAEHLPNRALKTELATGIIFSKSALLSRAEAILSDRRDQIQKFSRLALLGTLCAAVLSIFAAIALPLGEKNPVGDMVTVSGKVIYNGTPVEGATVYLQTFDFHLGFLEKAEKITETKKDGSFSYKIDASKLNAPYKWSLPVVVAYYPLSSIVWQKLSKEIDLKNITLQLSEQDAAAGIVQDNEGNPIKGAELFISSLSLQSDSDYSNSFSNKDGGIPEMVVRTGDNGEFVVTNIPKDSRIYFEVFAPGYAKKYTEAILTGSKDNIITLEPEGRIEGKVTFGDTGEPVRGIKVYTRDYGLWSPVRTDKSGVYVLKNLMPGKYSISVLFEEEFSEWTLVPLENIVVEEEETVKGADLILIKGGVVSGKVTDEDNGIPIVGHKVTALWPGSVNRLSLDTCLTDENGSFRLRVPPGKSKGRNLASGRLYGTLCITVQ